MLIIDVIGILANIYRYADVVFIGGSLIPRGGQNPLEPLYWRKPVITGPYMNNFPEIMNILREEGATIEVENADGLVRTILSSELELKQVADNADKIFTKHRGVVRRIIDRLEMDLQ